MDECLLGPEVSCCGEQTGMAHQYLYLFEIAASLPAEFGTGPAEIMGRQSSEVNLLRISQDQPPNHLIVLYPITHHSAALIHRPEDSPLIDPSRLEPEVDAGLGSGGHGDGPDAVAFAEQVGDDPPPFPLLEILDVEAQQLSPAKPAAEQQCQHGPVAFASQRLGAGHVEQLVGLVLHQPVADPGTALLDPGDPLDRRGDQGVKQLVVGELPGELANRREPEIDGCGGEAIGDEGGPVLLDGRLGEAGSLPCPGRFHPEPGEEACQPGAVGATGVLRGDPIEHKRDQPRFRCSGIIGTSRSEAQFEVVWHVLFIVAR